MSNNHRIVRTYTDENGRLMEVVKNPAGMEYTRPALVNPKTGIEFNSTTWWLTIIGHVLSFSGSLTMFIGLSPTMFGEPATVAFVIPGGAVIAMIGVILCGLAAHGATLEGPGSFGKTIFQIFWILLPMGWVSMVWGPWLLTRFG